MDDIAAEAGVSRRTFFRYFDSKPEVLWSAFDAEVDELRALFDQADDTLPVMDAVRQVVLAANHYAADDVPELRTHMNLIACVPALAASATTHYDHWERQVAAYVGDRTGQSASALIPMTVGEPPSPPAARPTNNGPNTPTPTSPITSTSPSPHSAKGGLSR